TLATPAENREEKVIAVYPADWAEWAKSAGKAEMPQPPEEQPAATPQAVSKQDGNSTLSVGGPTSGASIRGAIDIRGTASGRAFASYKVEFGEGSNPSNWTPIGGVHSAPVNNGVLERWDTKSLNGLYKLRITLTEKAVSAPSSTTPPVRQGTPSPAVPPTPTPIPAGAPKVIEIPVVVDNTAPTVTVTYPTEGAVVKKDQTAKVTLTAQVADNNRVSKTDFYVDDQLVGSSNAIPTTVEWTATAGPHMLRVVARDPAGNETKSADVRFQVQ
ncbi:MAG TPA: Ig-like domain-containing protein, partial [Chloroflexota bacterium]|nr:Ig-like domain-containing protein [Chloroflexota bacterium]